MLENPMAFLGILIFTIGSITRTRDKIRVWAPYTHMAMLVKLKIVNMFIFLVVNLHYDV